LGEWALRAGDTGLAVWNSKLGRNFRPRLNDPSIREACERRATTAIDY
jgi:hypothetical protein